MDNIKDWFLEHPKYIKAFADAQEAFEQAKAELDDKILNDLREKFKGFGYNFGNVESKEDEWHWWKGRHCRICNINQNIFLRLSIIIDKDYLLFFGIMLFENNELISENHERYSKIFSELRESCSIILEKLKTNVSIWLFYKYVNEQNVAEKVKFAYNLDSSLDNFIQEILLDIQKLKDSDKFKDKDYEWLV